LKNGKSLSSKEQVSGHSEEKQVIRYIFDGQAFAIFQSFAK
jgi:hypothetical protein